MTTHIRIALIGDRSEHVPAHPAIETSLAACAAVLRRRVEFHWLPTDAIGMRDQRLREFDGLWCVPGSPYRSMDGALTAIRFARELAVPFLGTCGGFQHAAIEYARNVLGLHDADHAESNPAAATLLVTPLACSLVGREGVVRLNAGSRAARCFGRLESRERHHCNFELNPKYISVLDQGGLKISGFDEDGAARVIELPDHPFYLATLFQPERSPTPPHPLIAAFVAAAASFRLPVHQPIEQA